MAWNFKAAWHTLRGRPVMQNMVIESDGPVRINGVGGRDTIVTGCTFRIGLQPDDPRYTTASTTATYNFEGQQE